MGNNQSEERPTERMNDDITEEVYQSPEESIELIPEKVITKLLKREHDSDKYIIIGKVAQGGMGAIYKVFDQDLKRISVLKIVLPGVLADTFLFRRFIEEARITGKLEHPNIIPVHDLGILEDNRLFFSMKFVEGESLSSILKKIRDRREKYLVEYNRFRLLTIFRKVCDAIAFAHSKNFIHRDIKPDNIMVGPYGEALLMDWGLARSVDKNDEDHTDDDESGESNNYEGDVDGDDIMKTRYGVVKGTPAYMSPEQAKGLVVEIDHRSDIYLLGATLYAIATLNVPFVGNDIYEILANAENGNFIPPARRAPELEIPLELCRIIEKAMAYEKEDRYQTVEELSHDLDDLMSGNIGSIKKIFSAGEYLMREGEEGHEAYVILTGRVEVTTMVRGKQLKLIDLTKGDVIGEMALILQAPRTATVKATEYTEVVLITDDTMKQGLGQLPPWMGKVIDSLAERLRVANANMHPLSTADCNYHVLNQLRLIYCYWSDPHPDPKTNSLIGAINTNNVIHEIALNLSIAKERVMMIVTHLFDFNLLRICDKENFYIPNFALFNEFVEYAHQHINLDRVFTTERTPKFYAADKKLIVHHCRDDHEGKISEMTPLEITEEADLITCKTPEDKVIIFDGFLNQIRSTVRLPAVSD